MTKGKLLLWVVALLIAGPVWGQGTGTKHGVLVTFTPGTLSSTAPPGTTIAASNIYRCTGDATICLITSSNWIVIDTIPPGTATDSYLDTSSLTAGQFYSYAETTLDNNGNESAFGTINVVLFQVKPNPNSPTGCTAKVQ